VRPATRIALYRFDLLDDGGSVESDLTRFEEDASCTSGMAERGRFLFLLLAAGIVGEDGLA
jgi:hypothetical protein